LAKPLADCVQGAKRVAEGAVVSELASRTTAGKGLKIQWNSNNTLFKQALVDSNMTNRLHVMKSCTLRRTLARRTPATFRYYLLGKTRLNLEQRL